MAARTLPATLEPGLPGGGPGLPPLRQSAGALLGAALRSHSSTNVVATGVRTVAKLCWGLAVPACLAVTDFGRYALLQSSVAMASQISLMGAPQVVLRNPDRAIPIGGILLHSLLLSIPLSLLGLATAGLGGAAIGIGAAGAIVLILQQLATSRLKSLRTFGGVLHAEGAGAAILLAGAAVLLAWRAGFPSPLVGLSFVGVYSFDVAAALLILAVAVFRQTATLRADLTTSGTRQYLPGLYSVGALVMMESLFWRLQLYFLNASPDGTEGVSVFALSLQLTQIIFLAATATTDAWWPAIAQLSRSGGEGLTALIRTRDRQYRIGYLVVAAGFVAALPLVLHFGFHRYASWSAYVFAFVAVRMIAGLTGFWSGVLYATGNESRLYRPAIAAALVTVGGGVSATVNYGLKGAIVVFALTQLTLSGLTYHAYSSYLARADER